MAKETKAKAKTEDKPKTQPKAAPTETPKAAKPTKPAKSAPVAKAECVVHLAAVNPALHVTQGHPGDSGYDLRMRAWVDPKAGKGSPEIVAPVTVKPGSRVFVKTGVKLNDITPGYELQVRPKSGLSTWHGVHIHLGTVDNQYRGEVSVVFHNLGTEDIRLVPGSKLAQIVAQKIPTVQYIYDEPGTAPTETSRGADGFGSTGK